MSKELDAKLKTALDESRLTATALCLFYGLGFALRKSPKSLPPEGNTPLKTKIEQMQPKLVSSSRAAKRFLDSSSSPR
jgi:hypothetical protein